jgi:secreted trypsin-like serine protease
MAALIRVPSANAGWGQFCGGAVIAARRVLTTAHCADEKRARDIDVLIGRTRLSQPGGTRIDVKSISVFPGYVSGRTPSLDAAVLTLAADAGVPPLRLALPGESAAWAPGTLAWTMGWGRLTAEESPGGYDYYADRLRELQQPIQGDDACEGVYGLGWRERPYRPSWELCVGSPADRAGTCYGDSGAPLVVGGPGGWLAVGIDVASDACASPGYFDVNVRVDQISSFALQPALTAQPDPTAAPRVIGRLVAGTRVRCTTGRWRGRPASFAVRWWTLGKRPHRLLGHDGAYRLTSRDAARGVRCTVTATNRGGRLTARSRPLRPRR